LQKQQKATQYYKLKHNKYLVTPKRCVVIHWYQDQIHINTVSATSIQKVQTYRSPNGEISVLFDTKPSSDFEMAYYTILHVEIVLDWLLARQTYGYQKINKLIINLIQDVFLCFLSKN
jgi:hypothetical protein